jgi:hypothetical protein
LAFEAWDNGDAAHSYHLLKKNAIRFQGGPSLDLCLLLSANNLNRGHVPARPGNVYSAHVALVADFNAPYAVVMKTPGFPKGTAIDVVLASPGVKATGDAWPYVKRVYVYYDLFDNRWVEHNPSGFKVNVEFTASLTQEIGGKRLYLSVASGLDPARMHLDENELSEGFQAQDTLGEVQGSGSNEWWQGVPAVVEANKHQYLKKQD